MYNLPYVKLVKKKEKSNDQFELCNIVYCEKKKKYICSEILNKHSILFRQVHRLF